MLSFSPDQSDYLDDEIHYKEYSESTKEKSNRHSDPTDFG